GDRAACLADVRAALAHRAGMLRRLGEEDTIDARGLDRTLCDLGVDAAWPKGSDPAALAAAFELAETGRARALVTTLSNPIAEALKAAPADLRSQDERAREA